MIDAPVPVPSDDQVLVKTSATTLCTSDVIDIEHNPFGLGFPAVLGHEASGTIVEVGRAVRSLSAGQRVATHPVHPCRRCDSCKAGYGHLCENMLHFGLNMPGTFAEYYVAREDRVRATEVDGLRACLAEPLSVCLEALEQARLSPDSSLLIIGDGPFGVIMARLAERKQVKRLVLVGWSDFRLSFAAGSCTINIRGMPDPVGRLLQGNHGAPYDAVILAVASSEAIDQALRCLRPKGRLVIFAGYTEAQTIDLNLVHLKELELVGACNDEDRFDDALTLLKDASWSELITHQITFEDFERAFELVRFRKDECMKVALMFPGQGT
jgi:threonine dehydrogenase-like Zn-dependent dehydrogenase